VSSKATTIGLIGAGRIGAEHARTIRKLDGVGDILVADVDVDRAQAVADELQGKVSSIDKILSEVEAVVITSPTGEHARMLIAAAEAGVPVFCEKPVALDVPTTKQVLEVVKRTGTPTQIGFMRRFDQGYVNARKLIASGDLGELRRVHVLTGDFPPPPASFVKGSGGLYKDCVIHDADAIRWVTGREIVEVFTIGKNRGASYFGEAGDIDEGVGVMELDDGTLATMQVTRYNGAGYDVRMELACTKETISVGFNTFMPVTSAEPDFTFQQAGDRFPSFYPRFAPAYAVEIGAFIDMVHNGGPSPATVEDALTALYVCEALDLSRAEHRPVRIDEVR
jgi:myo-inositol 2-dehydrogenase/D-chiro-inositol 1-dehydrogenase